MSTTTEAEAKRYNGWTNYETWIVKLWMDNDQGSQEYWRERTEEIVKEARDADEARLGLVVAMEDWHRSGSFELLDDAGMTSSVWADLMSAALDEVNWREIAEHLLEE
jgi:hypothetical protein